MRAELSSLYDGLRNRNSAAHASIQDMIPLGDGFFKVVAAVNDVKNEEQFAEAVASETDGAGRLVPGSTIMRGRIVAGVVRANARSRPVDASLQMVTACTARDAGGHIWNVVNDGSGKRAIIQENADDLEAMLRERMASRTVVANPSEGRGVSTASFANGDVVRYVDTASGETKCALAFRVGNETIAVNTACERTRIHPQAIMQSVAMEHLGRDATRLRDAMAETATTALSPEELDTTIAFLGRCGILSDQMADRMRSLSNTPAPIAA